MSEAFVSDTKHDLYLLRVEGQNFDSVIYDTHDLSTMAGGSYLLAAIPRGVEAVLRRLEEEGRLRTHRTIQSAASTGLFAVCSGSNGIAPLLSAVKRRLAGPFFRHFTVSVEIAEIGGAAVDVDASGALAIPDAALRAIDPGLLDRLAAEAKWTQMRAPNTAIPEGNPEACKACCEDHVRPAIGAGKLARSPSVAARRRMGKDYRWQSGGKPERIAAAQSFDEMTGHSEKKRWNGRLAVICIDGKGFTGLRQRLCKDGESLKWFSDELARLQEAFHANLMDGWRKATASDRYFFPYFPSAEDRQPGRVPGQLLRLQRLVSAGDDSTYLMPAWLAWEFLEKFFSHPWILNHRVEGNEAAEPQEIQLSFRAGVVICHAKAPIHPIHDLAQKLESVVAAKDGRSMQNPIAYEVLKSFDFVGAGIEEYRKQKRACLEPHEALLDGKEIANLECRLKELKEKASSGEIKTPLRWHDTLARLKDPKFQKGDLYHLSQWRDYIF